MSVNSGVCNHCWSNVAEFCGGLKNTGIVRGSINTAEISDLRVEIARSLFSTMMRNAGGVSSVVGARFGRRIAPRYVSSVSARLVRHVPHLSSILHQHTSFSRKRKTPNC